MAEQYQAPSSGNDTPDAGNKGGAVAGSVRVYDRPAGADKSPIMKILPLLIALIALAAIAWWFLSNRAPAPADNRPTATQSERSDGGAVNPPGPGQTAPSGGTNNPPGPAGR